jgi:hypothetical protein
MTARLGDFDVLHSGGPKVCCDELGRSAAVGCVSGDAGDAGDAQQGLERLESGAPGVAEVALQGDVDGGFGDGVRHRALQRGLSRCRLYRADRRTEATASYTRITEPGG